MICRMRFIVILLAALLLGTSLSASIRSKKPKSLTDSREVKQTLYGFKIGMFGSGDATIKNGIRYDAGLESGYSLAGFVDLKTRSLTSIGLSMEIHHIKPEAIDNSKNMLEFSLNVKGAFHKERTRMVIRPCLSLGYGMLGGERHAWFVVNSSNYFIVKGTMEILLLSRARQPGFLLEVGVFASPFGKETGDNGHSLYADPRLLMRLGMVFR